MPGKPGSAGGKALFQKRGSAYMAEIGRRGGISTAKNRVRINVSKILTEMASAVVKLAKGYAKTDRIRNAIKTGVVEQRGDGTFSIAITVDTTEETGAPEAPAYEYGSGIHSTKGPAEKYPIHPKNKSALAFVWEGHESDPPWGSPKFIGIGSGGRFLFHYVDHPGVAPIPFIQPAVDEIMPLMKEALGKGFKQAMIEGIFK